MPTMPAWRQCGSEHSVSVMKSRKQMPLSTQNVCCYRLMYAATMYAGRCEDAMNLPSSLKKRALCVCVCVS